MQPEELPKFTILAIHGEEVTTVEGNVARVRFWIGAERKEIDEDIPLPEVPRGLPQTLEMYQFLMKPTIEKRLTELEAQNV